MDLEPHRTHGERLNGPEGDLTRPKAGKRRGRPIAGRWRASMGVVASYAGPVPLSFSGGSVAGESGRQCGAANADAMRARKSAN